MKLAALGTVRIDLRQIERALHEADPAADSCGYFLAGRVFMMLSISLISRGALLILSSPRSVIT